MPRGTRAHRGEVLQRWLAAWFAALLAVGPLARPSIPVELAGAPVASPESLVAHDDTLGEQPAANLRSSQPLAPGVLSRVPLLDTARGLPPLKSPLLRPAPDRPVLALQAIIALGGEPREVLQRSSVGTARTPTGPPA